MNELQAAFEAKQTEIFKLQGELQQMPLPDFFESPPCCENRLEALQVVELGYQRWEEVNDISEPGDDPHPWMHARTAGWDSMSETGYISYLECNQYNGGCGAIFAMPKNLDWD